MKTKALEILIVVIVLIALAFVVGCKDEAGAQDVCDPVDIEINELNFVEEPNDIECDKIYFKED